VLNSILNLKFLRNFNLRQKVDFIILIFLIVFSIVLFSYSLFLKVSNTEETDLFETVSLSANVEPEFDSQGIFWWLLEGSNFLTLTNYSNENKNVELNLIFERDPCNNLNYIEVNGSRTMTDDEDLTFKQLIELNAYEFKKIKVINFLQKECIVSNDKRYFGSKLRKWYVR